MCTHRSKTAIVGSSGSGKSSILKLILRTYDPDSGTVTLDGQNLREVSLHSLRGQLALVPQETVRLPPRRPRTRPRRNTAPQHRANPVPTWATSVCLQAASLRV